MQRLIGTIIESTTMDITSTMPWQDKGVKLTSTFLPKTIKFYNSDRNITCIIIKGIYKAIGVAVCHEDDEFDMIFGCNIAELRARENLYKLMVQSKIKKGK